MIRFRKGDTVLHRGERATVYKTRRGRWTNTDAERGRVKGEEYQLVRIICVGGYQSWVRSDSLEAP